MKFQNTIFEQNSSFTKREFLGNGLFKWVYFARSVDFGVAKIYEYADFALCSFNERVNFSFAELKKGANFGNTFFSKESIFNSFILDKATFINATFVFPPAFKALTMDKKLSFENAQCFNGTIKVMVEGQNQLSLIVGLD